MNPITSISNKLFKASAKEKMDNPVDKGEKKPEEKPSVTKPKVEEIEVSKDVKVVKTDVDVGEIIYKGSPTSIYVKWYPDSKTYNLRYKKLLDSLETLTKKVEKEEETKAEKVPEKAPEIEKAPKMPELKLPKLEKPEEPMEEKVELPKVPKEPKATESKTVASLKRGGTTIKFFSGPTLETSYFVVSGPSKGDFKIVRASDIVPPEVAKLIENDDPQVASPEEIMSQILDQTDGDFKKVATLLNNEIKVVEELKKEASLKKKAAMEPPLMSVRTDEIEKEKTKGIEPPTMSMYAPEVEKAPKEVPKPEPSSVKKYFQRLPTTGIGEQVQSIQPQSSLKEAYDSLKEELGKTLIEKKKLEEKVGEYEVEKNARLIEENSKMIVAHLVQSGMIPPHRSEDVTKFLKQLSLDEVSKIGTFISTVLNPTPQEDTENLPPMKRAASKNIPQPTLPSGSVDLIQRLAEIW